MAFTEHPSLRASSLAQLEAVAERVRPLELAEQRVLPVLDALVPLLADGGLRRGTAHVVTGPLGATSLALALAAGPSRAGSWVAVVGMPELGLAAAAELGVALERVAVVAPPPPERWATVVAALLDAFDVVLVHPPRRGRAADARRLLARARERGAVLLCARTALDGVDGHLDVTSATWHGIGDGHGHLRARQVEVVATGRRAAARPRHARLWLTDPVGRVRPVDAPRPAPAAGGRRTVVPFPGLGVTTAASAADDGVVDHHGSHRALVRPAGRAPAPAPGGRSP